MGRVIIFKRNASRLGYSLVRMGHCRIPTGQGIRPTNKEPGSISDANRLEQCTAVSRLQEGCRGIRGGVKGSPSLCTYLYLNATLESV